MISTDVLVLAYEPIPGGVLPVILEGRGPAAPDEIALGKPVARRLGASIGDVVVGYTVIPGDEATVPA